MHAFDAAKIRTVNGTEEFVLKKHDLNKIIPSTKKTWLTPTLFFMVFMFVVSFLTGAKRIKPYMFDRIFFSVLGIAGWILLLLWVATDHGVTEKNLNLIWASPLLFPAALFLGKKRWASRLFVIYSIIFIPGFLYFQIFTDYKFSLAVLFICLTIAIRLIFLFKNKYIGFTSNKAAVN